jgi:SAM-dependent methyltransferase
MTACSAVCRQAPHIFDVGSRGGLFTNYIAAQRPDVDIIGVDLSPAQVQRASKRMRAYPDRVRFQIGDGALPASPNLAIFRTWIAGRSIDLDDARALADRIDLVDKDVSRIADAPILMISGRRAPIPADS